MAQEKWIKGAIEHPGAFSAQAKAAGMTTREFIRKVLAKGSRYTARTKRRANLARTLMGLNPNL